MSKNSRSRTMIHALSTPDSCTATASARSMRKMLSSASSVHAPHKMIRPRLPTGVPLDGGSGVRHQQQQRRAEDDAVNREWRIAVAADIAEQPFDRDERGGGGDHERDRE